MVFFPPRTPPSLAVAVMYVPLPMMQRGTAMLNETLAFFLLFTREGLGQHSGQLADCWYALLLQTVLSPVR